jgi:hypothetical protein
MAKRPVFTSAQDVADFYTAQGEQMTAKKVRAIHRRAIKASGGTIGKDTPGKGKRYGKDVFAIMAESVEATLKSDDAEQDAPSA